MQVNGVANADGASLQYKGIVNLVDGENTVTIVATYADGQTKSTTTSIIYNAPPTITITSPTDKITLGAVNPNSPVT
jgi:hypothetical protein